MRPRVTSRAQNQMTMATRDGGDNAKGLHLRLPDLSLSNERDPELSPNTQENLSLLLSYVKSGQATLKKDDDGKVQFKYTNEKRITLSHVDKSKAHAIQDGKDEKDIQMRVKECLEIIEVIKEHRSPSGVVLDKSAVTIGPRGTYHTDKQFHYLQEYLGRGNSAGGIFVAVDNKTETRHGVKKVLIADFRTDEVRAWCRLNDSDSFPTLYLFRLEDNAVVMHMEEITNGVTLDKIIEEHMANLRLKDPDLVRPFSLCVFHDLLSVVKEMHDKNWAHCDLHGGNVMLTKDTMSVKVLDFGLARQLKDGLKFDHGALENDILNAVRLFCGVYTGNDFENNFMLEKEIKNKTLHQVLQETTGLSKERREELVQLITMTYQVTQNSQQAGYGDTTHVMEHIEGTVYQENHKSVKEVMRIAAAVLFPEFYYGDRDLRSKEEGDEVSDGGMDEEDSSQSVDFDLDAAAAAVPDDFLNKLNVNF